MKLGKFISLEGIDGSGKSTHVEFIANYLRERQLEVVTTREPGGTEIGEQIRNILLHSHNGMHKVTELLLMFASRQELIHRLIAPSLNSGKWVVSDRFIDASVAYQGVGRSLGVDSVMKLVSLLEPQIIPDCTLLFDTTIDIAVNRLNRNRDKDRIENETRNFFEQVQNGYYKIATEHPNRVKIIRTDREIEITRHELIAQLDILLVHNAN